MPMVVLMNAIAQASAAPVSGSKLDNRRVMAAIVDLLIVTAGAVVILVAGNALSGDRPGALAAVILGWARYYFFALESGEGQTLGKRLMKIRVVRADGRPAGMGEIAVRTILRMIDNYVVGMLVMIATGERRQRIGDLAAGTIVVDASGPVVMAPPAPAVDAFQPVDHKDDVEAEPEEDLAASQTITLPSRPAPPETLADLTEPEDGDTLQPVPESEPDDGDMLQPVPESEDSAPESADAEEPVLSEVAGVPATTEDPSPEEPQDELPPAMSPALEELSDDLAAAHVEPEADEAEQPAEDDASESDEPVNVKSVETVSAMDLIMGAAEESAPKQDDSTSDRDAEGPASA